MNCASSERVTDFLEKSVFTWNDLLSAAKNSRVYAKLFLTYFQSILVRTNFFLRSFCPALRKLHFGRRKRTVLYFIVSLTLRLKSLGSSWGNSSMGFIIQDISSHYACGKLKLDLNIEIYQSIVTGLQIWLGKLSKNATKDIYFVELFFTEV